MKHKFKCCNKTHLTIKLKEVNIRKWVEKKGKQKRREKSRVNELRKIKWKVDGDRRMQWKRKKGRGYKKKTERKNLK